VIAIAKGKATGLNENPAAAEKQIGDEKSPSAGQSDPTPAPDGVATSKRWIKPAMVAVALIAAIGIAVAVWYRMKPSGPGVGFVSGNGRVEATEIDVATKLSGRVREILANEGDFVLAEQVLARMQIDTLDAQRDEAWAQSRQAATAVASAEAQVAARQSDTAAARAMVTLRMSDLDAAQRRFARTEKLAKKGAVPFQSLDDDRASVHGAEAAVKAAEAQVSAAEAGIKAAQTQVDGAESGVTASLATITRIEADILDSELKSPRDGRVQYRVAQPGEVLPAGGKVMNVVDLSDVYLTFFLPETAVGKVPLGSEVRVVLDAAPHYVIPAEISYVASVAQFTPKTVETASERQKLMFRVKARFGRDLLMKNMKTIKTGLPGVAWLKLDANTAWPEELAIRIPQ
jgi:HlyD family secretion protein